MSTLDDLNAQLAAAQAQLTLDQAHLNAAQAAVTKDQATIVALQARIVALNRVWCGLWPHSVDLDTFKTVRTWATHLRTFRARGDKLGRLDFPFSKLDDMAWQASNGVLLSANINPRLGTSPKKTGIDWLDVTAGKYDKDLTIAAQALAPFDSQSECEVYSECNVKGKPTQPTPINDTLQNFEAGFIYIVNFLRSHGVKLRLGTSIAGPGAFKEWQKYLTPGILEHSDFIGFDWYIRPDTHGGVSSARYPSSVIPQVLTIKDSSMGATNIPLVICEWGVDKTLPATAISSIFADAVTTKSKLAPNELLGWMYNDGDTPDGAYVIDVGSPCHDGFLAWTKSFA
jgi:hypothetical protein